MRQPRLGKKAAVSEQKFVNSLNMMSSRTWRPAFNMISWDAVKHPKRKNARQEEVLSSISQWCKNQNSTRGFTPGLIDPRLPDSTGNRVPLPTLNKGKGVFKGPKLRIDTSGTTVSVPSNRKRKAPKDLDVVAGEVEDQSSNLSSDDDTVKLPGRKRRKQMSNHQDSVENSDQSPQTAISSRERRRSTSSAPIFPSLESHLPSKPRRPISRPVFDNENRSPLSPERSRTMQPTKRCLPVKSGVMRGKKRRISHDDDEEVGAQYLPLPGPTRPSKMLKTSHSTLDSDSITAMKTLPRLQPRVRRLSALAAQPDPDSRLLNRNAFDCGPPDQNSREPYLFPARSNISAQIGGNVRGAHPPSLYLTTSEPTMLRRSVTQASSTVYAANQISPEGILPPDNRRALHQSYNQILDPAGSYCQSAQSFDGSHNIHSQRPSHQQPFLDSRELANLMPPSKEDFYTPYWSHIAQDHHHVDPYLNLLQPPNDGLDPYNDLNLSTFMQQDAPLFREFAAPVSIPKPPTASDKAWDASLEGPGEASNSASLDLGYPIYKASHTTGQTQVESNEPGLALSYVNDDGNISQPPSLEKVLEEVANDEEFKAFLVKEIESSERGS